MRTIIDIPPLSDRALELELLVFGDPPPPPKFPLENKEKRGWRRQVAPWPAKKENCQDHHPAKIRAAIKAAQTRRDARG